MFDTRFGSDERDGNEAGERICMCGPGDGLVWESDDGESLMFSLGGLSHPDALTTQPSHLLLALMFTRSRVLLMRISESVCDSVGEYILIHFLPLIFDPGFTNYTDLPHWVGRRL